MTLFDCVYGMNPFTPLELTSLSSDIVLRLDRNKRAESMKKLHEKVRNQLEKNNQEVAKRANKGRRRLVLEPSNWVWVHLRKKRFPTQTKANLMPRGNDPFQVLERINDNAYKIDLPPKYQVHNTFDVCDLSPVDTIKVEEPVNLRPNSFQDGEDDTGAKSSSSFTRSQSRELQSLQAMFMKMNSCECVMNSSKGVHKLKCEEGP
ncbi:uncharacterized protein LOC124896676 [Capsicum annuum]|uniref:uncharacterized protein LOC124896676 n=1 Tax=Capsicum annuum TaxID=4072 RepID=UPI001FB16C44|nr:uncharacterized protein LOC124896676 [Capsicum annuum]